MIASWPPFRPFLLSFRLSVVQFIDLISITLGQVIYSFVEKRVSCYDPGLDNGLGRSYLSHSLHPHVHT